MSSVARTSGSSAVGRHAGGVGEPRDLPEQRDEMVRRDGRGRVVARPGRRRVTRNGRMPSETARRSTVGRPVDRAPRARAAGRRRARATATTAAGAATRPRRRDAPRAACASSSSVHAPERWTTSAPGSQARRERGRGVGDRGVGRRDDHEVGVARRRRRPSRPARRARGRAAVLDGASGARPATATTRPPAGGRARPRSWSRRGPGPTRANARCVVDRAQSHSTSSFQPRCGVPDYSGSRNASPVRAHAVASRRGIRVRPARVEVGERHEHERPLRHPRVRDHEVGLVDPLVADEQHVDVERARPPALASRTRSAVGLEPLRDARAAPRASSVGVDARRPRSGSRPAPGRRPARSRTPATPRPRRRRRSRASPSTASWRCASRSPRFDPSPRYARASRSRGHRSMRTATWSTIARTGGCSLRTVTATPVTRSSTRHTSAMRVASRSSSW